MICFEKRSMIHVEKIICVNKRIKERALLDCYRTLGIEHINFPMSDEEADSQNISLDSESETMKSFEKINRYCEKLLIYVSYLSSYYIVQPVNVFVYLLYDVS